MSAVAQTVPQKTPFQYTRWHERTIPDHAPPEYPLWRYGTMCQSHQQHNPLSEGELTALIASGITPPLGELRTLIPGPFATLNALNLEATTSNILWLFRVHHQHVPESRSPTEVLRVKKITEHGLIIAIPSGLRFTRIGLLNMWGLDLSVGDKVVAHQSVAIEVAPDTLK